MSLLLALVLWFVLATPVGIVLGQAIRLADKREGLR